MRKEHDLLGEKLIPDDAHYGVQTARAMENFHISGVPLSQYPDLIRALAMGGSCGRAGQLRLQAVQ